MFPWVEALLCAVPAIVVGTVLFVACRNLDRYQSEASR